MALDQLIRHADATFVDWEDFTYTLNDQCPADASYLDPVTGLSTSFKGEPCGGFVDLDTATFLGSLNELRDADLSTRNIGFFSTTASQDGITIPRGVWLAVDIPYPDGRASQFRLWCRVSEETVDLPRGPDAPKIEEIVYPEGFELPPDVGIALPSQFAWRFTLLDEIDFNIENFPKIWAEVVDVEDTYNLANLVGTPERQVNFRIRYNTDVNLTQAIWYDGFRYNLAGVQEEGRRRYMILTCNRTISGRIYDPPPENGG